MISYVIPSGPGVFPFTAVELHASLTSSIETWFQVQLKGSRILFASVGVGGGGGNSVFLKALHLPSKVSFPSIKGIRP